MNLFKEGDNETSENKFDARVVHTVRNLQKFPSKHSDENKSSIDSDNSNSNSNDKPDMKRNSLAKSVNIRKKSAKENQNNMRISIDGSGHSTSDSNKENSSSKKETSKNNVNSFKHLNTSLNTNSKTNSFTKNKAALKTSSSTNIKNVSQAHKTKTEFQKRLMNENNLNKYRIMCTSMLKEDEELKKLCDFCNIFSFNFNSTSSMFGNSTALIEAFFQDNFFSDKFFLYKLESLLVSDVSKQKKEKFFKEEIKKFLELKALDIQCENKLKGLNLAIDNHIKNIENFDFFS